MSLPTVAHYFGGPHGSVDTGTLRACYYARVSSKTGLPLKSSAQSAVLSGWPAEMRIFSSKSAVEAAAPCFQQYLSLNSSERKAAPKRAAPSPVVGATPQQQRTEQLCPASERQCSGTVNVSTALRTFTVVAASQYKKTRKRELLYLSRIEKPRDVRQSIRHAKLQHSLARNSKQVRKYIKDTGRYEMGQMVYLWFRVVLDGKKS